MYNIEQYIKDHVQNILNERLIQKAQSNINNNIDNAAKKISSVIRYETIVENIMSMHITDKQLQTLVCEAFKYFDKLPDVFELWDTTHNSCYQTAILDFQESFESNIKRLIKETGPDDPNIRKLLTYYTYCCIWANIDPFDEDSLLSEKEELDIRVKYRPDYNYSPGSSGSYYEAPEPDELDITITEYNSETVIKLFGYDEKEPIVIDNIFEKFFDEERFRSAVCFRLTAGNEDYF
jgi:hypothetical protein